jgi:hypothetical protein
MTTMRVVFVVACASVIASCLVDFDDLDPRLATGGTPSTGGDGGTGAQGGAATSGGGGAGASGGMTGAGGAGGAMAVDIEYTAVIAECVTTTAPDPDVCLAAQNDDVFTVDASDGPMSNVIHGYLRFNLDNQLAGRTVTNVTLRLTVGTNMNAQAPMSGEIWQVAPFTRPDLFLMIPAAMTMLASDQGAVVLGQVVDSVLPTSLVAANGAVYLGVVPLASRTDGVDYWNLQGVDPPKLIVTVE